MTLLELISFFLILMVVFLSFELCPGSYFYYILGIEKMQPPWVGSLYLASIQFVLAVAKPDTAYRLSSRRKLIRPYDRLG